MMFGLPGWAYSMISRGLSGAIPPEMVIENSLFPRGIIMGQFDYSLNVELFKIILK